MRFARVQLNALFADLPNQPGYNKRLRNLADTIGWLVGMLARDTSLWGDGVWVADSTIHSHRRHWHNDTIGAPTNRSLIAYDH